MSLGSGNIEALLLPNPPRDFPFRRAVRSLLRALHILTSGVLLGGHIFLLPDVTLLPWLIGTLVTGLALVGTDLYASCAMLLEVRGVAVIVKLLLTALVGIFPEFAIELLVTVLFIGSISSHMPGRYRHKILLSRPAIAVDERRG